MRAAMVEFEPVITDCSFCLTNVVTVVIAEVGGSHHRLLILPCVCLVWKVVRSLMVELEAGHHMLFILPDI